MKPQTKIQLKFSCPTFHEDQVQQKTTKRDQNIETLNSKLSQKKKMKFADQSKKIQNSLSRIKSNHFYKNLGAKIRTWASNSNIGKQHSKKNKRNGNLSNVGQAHMKSTNSNYYTHRENNEGKVDRDDNKLLDEITEVQINSSQNPSKRHCESTKVSERKHFQNFYNMDSKINQMELNKNIINKHSSLLVNGSQTARNHNDKEDKIFNQCAVESSESSTPSKSPSNVSLSYHRKYKKQKKMKMMILKNGRIFNNKNLINKFHYFPDKSKRKLLKDTNTSNKKSLKNSKSRTRYAEYDEKDETIYDQIN